jgi:protein TonB
MKLKTHTSSLGKFIVLSVALHLVAGGVLYWLAPRAERREPVPYPYIVKLFREAPAIKPPVPEKKRPKVKRPRPQVAKKPPAPEYIPEHLTEEQAPAVQVPTKTPEDSTEPPLTEGQQPEEDASAAPGERLFDPEVLAGVLKKDKKSSPQDSSVTFDTKELRHYSYMRKLKEKIEYVWEYPTEAASKGIYGDLLIRFVIRKDGTLGAVELLRTSGHRRLDRAAMEALRDGAPYWPLPEDWDTNSLTVSGHFIYTLNAYYLR